MKTDKPMFDQEMGGRPSNTNIDTDLKNRIRNLLTDQSFCVLCTQGENQPYGSLIAFAFSDDLKKIFFTTPVATRKFRLLSECHRVALLIDSRCKHPEDMKKIEAVTVTGKAAHIEEGEAFSEGMELLKGRHQYLSQFINSDSTALFQIDAVRYFHVTRFQEVSQWTP